SPRVPARRRIAADRAAAHRGRSLGSTWGESVVPWRSKPPRGRLVFLGAGIENGHERFLRNVDAADRLHPLLAFLLLGPQLALARDVAAVALGGHVLAHGRDRFAGDDA